MKGTQPGEGATHCGPGGRVRSWFLLELCLTQESGFVSQGISITGLKTMAGTRQRSLCSFLLIISASSIATPAAVLEESNKGHNLNVLCSGEIAGRNSSLGGW